MATLVPDTARTRHRHQRHVDALLAEIDERRRQLYRRKAAGVRRAALRDLKRDLGDLQREIAAAVAPTLNG